MAEFNWLSILCFGIAKFTAYFRKLIVQYVTILVMSKLNNNNFNYFLLPFSSTFSNYITNHSSSGRISLYTLHTYTLESIIKT